MKRPHIRGYTVVELLIVLAVSGVILAAAILAVQGQQGKVSFSQAINDLSSKISSYGNTVQAGLLPGKYICETAGDTGRPALSRANPPTDPGASTDCIVLGLALQPYRHSLYAYLVLGNRTKDGKSVTTLADAMPEPGFKWGDPDDPGLAEQFKLNTYLELVWSKVRYTTDPQDQSPQHDSQLVGIYNSLESSAKGSMTGYSYSTFSGMPKSIQLINCIEEANPPGLCTSEGMNKNILEINQWDICFQSGQDSSQTAIVRVRINTTGLLPEVKFENCS